MLGTSPDRKKKKKKEGTINTLFSPVPSFLLPERRFTTLQFQLSPSAFGSQSIPSCGVGSGVANASATKMANMLHSLSPLRQNRAQKSSHVFSTPTQCVPPKPSQAKLIAQLVLPWLAVIHCSFNNTQGKSPPSLGISRDTQSNLSSCRESLSWKELGS